MKMNVVDYIKFEKKILNSKVDLDEFFNEFSKYYIKSPHDFLTISKDFYFTIKTMQDSLKYTDDNQRFAFERRLHRFCIGRHRILNPEDYRLGEQAPYVSIVSKLVSQENRVLDVGAGLIPYSSILMKDYFKKVGAMDQFFVSENALNVTGINAQNKYFDEKTSIDNYDYVVGRTPCSAIKSIVENCHNNNKGYLIKLCNCDLDAIALQNDGVYRHWNQILPEIDPNVKFSEEYDYAYNIDISKSEFSKIEYESNAKISADLENSFFGELKEYAKEHPVDMPEELITDILI